VTPPVAVVVPTVDRAALLDRCLSGLARPQGVEFEAVVVHDGDADVMDVVDRWRARLPLRGVQVAERDAASKRNAGWRATGAPVVAFTDDDCEPSEGWLAALVAPFAGDAAVELVQGRVEPHPGDAHVDGVFARTLRVPGPTDTYANANLAYRRRALDRTNGYDAAFWGGGEDTDLAWRVIESGGRVAFAHDALVHHAVRPAGLADHIRSLYRWQTLALVLRRHPHLRRLLHRRLFWKRSHPTALLAIAGLVLAPIDRRALALAAPAVARRVREAGVRDGLQLVVADLAEVAVVLTGSVRYRAVLL
jgi:cellulose synthase/poly-beta-1,6-N-acetylglucosamine synthase-like glycosyltransferase